MASKKRIGVLRGGPGLEYESSLKTGTNVLNYLPKEHYEKIDIFVDRDGIWHIQGLPVSPEELSREVDLIFNALHGDYGEDGTVQSFLDNLHIPYTGPGALTGALSNKKHLAKERFLSKGYRTPRHVLLSAYQPSIDGYLEDYAVLKAKEIHQKLSPPWIVKPLTGGSHIGIRVVKTFPELPGAIMEVGEAMKSVLVEELISGKSVSAFAVEGLRDKWPYVFPLLEYEKETIHCPARVSGSVRDEISRITEDLYDDFGCRHCANFDFIVTPRSQVYVLEVNANPKLIKERGLVELCDSVGLTFSDILSHVIELALERK